MIRALLAFFDDVPDWALILFALIIILIMIFFPEAMEGVK